MTWSIISQVTVVCFHRGFGGWELNFIESKAVLALHWSKTSIFHKAGWTVAPPFTHLRSFERMHLVHVYADQIKRRVNDVPNSQAFLCWKLSTSEKDLSFYFFFFLKYVYFKIRQQVRVFYELAKWHPTLDSIPSFYEVKIYKKNRFVYKTWIYERKVWTRLKLSNNLVCISYHLKRFISYLLSFSSHSLMSLSTSFSKIITKNIC